MNPCVESWKAARFFLAEVIAEFKRVAAMME
jgi:hypothetical protein